MAPGSGLELVAADANPLELGCNEGHSERAFPPVPLLLAAVAGPSGPIAGLPAAAAAAAGAGRDGAGFPVKGTALATPDADPVEVPRPAKPAGRRSPGQARWVEPAEPERPVMEVLFNCLEHGRRYYSVRLNGLEIFVGTRSECDRFLELHNQKVALEQAEARRMPRARPFPVRTYRAARA